MSEIVFRLPSMQITYGYVEVTGTPEEFGVADISDPYVMGIAYTAYVARFFEGEIEGAKIVASNMEAAPKAAPGKPVKGVSGVRQVKPDQKATEVIKEVLGATVVEGHEVGDTVTVGGTEFTKHSEVPWEQPAKAATPKPWENKGAAPKVADIDW